MKGYMKKSYVCIIENISERCDEGYCGKVHTMDEWIEILFPNSQEAKEYFKDFKEKEILDYLFLYYGKRLESLKKWEQKWSI